MNGMAFSAGRAQQINNYKQLKQSLSKENYIHREVQKAAGCYSNDSIEQNWRACINLNKNLDPEERDKISEDPDGRFDDAEDVEESSSVTSSFVSKNDPLSCKESPTKELFSAEESQETCDSQLRTSPASAVDETKPEAAPIQPSTKMESPLKTKPRRQRNALLLSLQKKIEIEKNVETDKKDTVGKNSADAEENAVLMLRTCENNAVLEDNKKDSTSEKSTVHSEGYESGNVKWREKSPSTIVEFKPRINTALECSSSANLAYNPGTGGECNPGLSIEHCPDMGLEGYPNMNTGVEHYPNNTAMGTGYCHNTNVENYPYTSVRYYPNPSAIYNSNVSGSCYPGSGEVYNPTHFSWNSVWYAPVHSRHGFRTDPLFAPTNVNMTTEFKYREEEFPPL